MIFVISVLATWRVVHLVAYEDGPWEVIARLREAVGNTEFGRLMDCHKCLSVWIAIAPALYLGRMGWDSLIFWPAISGGSILVQEVYGRVLR